jgi:tRNA U34 5-methylaminomethyl-2-thiouridine-forming methyltransferase MnmC
MGHKPQATSYKPLLTEDGSTTLIHPLFNEAYSSKHGALMQARELYLKLTGTDQHPAPKVLEIGFGLGVNFRITLESCLARGARLEYISYELFPAPLEALEAVQITLSTKGQVVWEELLRTWPPSSSFNLEGDWGKLQLHLEDVTQTEFSTNWATAIYFDPFSPDVNPEPWRLETLQKIFAACQNGATLATYSVQGQFRRDLATTGFTVQKVPGVGKKQWTVGKRVEGRG